MKHIQNLFVSITFLAGACGTSLAQSASCGFEGPSYSPGPLNGQNGWVATTDTGAASVVVQPRRAGNQAAKFDMNAAWYDVVAQFPCDVRISPNDSIVDVDWDFYYTYGNGFGWDIVMRAVDGRPVSWLWVDGGNMWFKTSGVEPVLVGAYLNEQTWGHFQASIDWNRHTTTLYINGQQGASLGFASITARGIGSFSLQSVMGGYTDACGLDEITIVARRTCAADVNADGIVDFFDYLDFVDAFALSAPVADFNHDAIIDFFDYLDFVDVFSRGC